MGYTILSYDVASGSNITPCNKIYKPLTSLVCYRFMGNVMMSITKSVHNDTIIFFTPEMRFQSKLKVK